MFKFLMFDKECADKNNIRNNGEDNEYQWFNSKI